MSDLTSLSLARPRDVVDAQTRETVLDGVRGIARLTSLMAGDSRRRRVMGLQ